MHSPLYQASGVGEASNKRNWSLRVGGYEVTGSHLKKSIIGPQLQKYNSDLNEH